MNRFHVHLTVADLPASIRFYNELFGTEPTVTRHDYAKWMLEDPRINFAISNTGRVPGIDHLGLQVDSDDELAALGKRLDAAGGSVVPEDAAICCYAKSDKLWTEDPQGTKWETFHTTGDATSYYGGESACATSGGSCTPDIAAMKEAAAAAPVGAAMAANDPTTCCAPNASCC
ncbi:MAG TPA: ArsI/CadI family heavy metal resistance metalloenzyme [Xanthomonadaceae bacterium]|nr:ArsI/CadI family heavy metal resistance metalloenzyme [Xanthomonadaceae bacterium]